MYVRTYVVHSYQRFIILYVTHPLRAKGVDNGERARGVEAPPSPVFEVHPV